MAGVGDVAALRGREVELLKRAGRAAGLLLREYAGGRRSVRHVEIERVDAAVPLIECDADLRQALDRSEVPFDPLAVPLGRPAGRTVAVDRVAGNVVVVVTGSHAAHLEFGGHATPLVVTG